MKLYPIFADLRDKPAVIIGGGAVASRKLKDLLDEAKVRAKAVVEEKHCPQRARLKTELASNTLLLVNLHNPALAVSIDCVGRAFFHTQGICTLFANHRIIEVVFT